MGLLKRWRRWRAQRREKNKLAILFKSGECQCDRCQGKEPWPDGHYENQD